MSDEDVPVGAFEVMYLTHERLLATLRKCHADTCARLQAMPADHPERSQVEAFAAEQASILAKADADRPSLEKRMARLRANRAKPRRAP